MNSWYGENSYIMQESPKSPYLWIVRLKAYPDVPFYCSVSDDPLSMSGPFVWDNFDEVFCKHAIKQFRQTHSMGKDDISYLDPIPFVFNTKARSLAELKPHYDCMTRFISFVKEKYPILISTGVFGMRMDVEGIRMKGGTEDDTWQYLHIAKVEGGRLIAKSYEDIYRELAPQVRTHAENPKRLVFHADASRSFDLGSDTFDDCLYKCLVLASGTPEMLKNDVLLPGQTSYPITLKSEDPYKFVTIELQGRNMGREPSPVLNATIVKAVVRNSEYIIIDGVGIDLKYDMRRQWVDPYRKLGIHQPRTEQEEAEGVAYKNIKILFEKTRYGRDIGSVVMTFRD
ncbi:MAG: D-aminoacyl-tRNA deacylase [Prevotella sp.]|nr:D-aminoacyl-tRNA deacylase [Prevotella sp.]